MGPGYVPLTRTTWGHPRLRLPTLVYRESCDACTRTVLAWRSADLPRIDADHRQERQAQVAHFGQQAMESSLIRNGSHQQRCAIFPVGDVKAVKPACPPSVQVFLDTDLVDVGHSQILFTPVTRRSQRSSMSSHTGRTYRSIDMITLNAASFYHGKRSMGSTGSRIQGSYFRVVETAL
jgi:hypothetical protein